METIKRKNFELDFGAKLAKMVIADKIYQMTGIPKEHYHKVINYFGVAYMEAREKFREANKTWKKCGIKDRKLRRSLARKARDKKFLAILAGQFAKEPHKYLDVIRTISCDKEGNILPSVASSPTFGPFIEMVRKAIPDEIGNSISEKELLDFSFSCLHQVADTEEGRERLARFIKESYAIKHDGDDPMELMDYKKDGKESLLSLMTKVAGQELLTNHRWDDCCRKFKNNIFEKDSSGCWKLKDNVNDGIRKMFESVKKELAGLPVKEETKTGIVVDVFQKILDDPEKRRALLPLCSFVPQDPGQRDKWEKEQKKAKDVIVRTGVEVVAENPLYREDALKGATERLKKKGGRLFDGFFKRKGTPTSMLKPTKGKTGVPKAVVAKTQRPGQTLQSKDTMTLVSARKSRSA